MQGGTSAGEARGPDGTPPAPFAALGAIFDVAPCILYLYDLVERRNVWGNHGMIALLGYDREQLAAWSGRLLDELLHPDDRDAYAGHAARLVTLRDGEVAEFEYRMRCADGAWRWLLSRDMVFLRDDAGRPVQIVGAALDVSERRRAQDALADTARELAREREQLALALRAGRFGIYEWRAGEQAIRWSPETYPLFGVDPASFVPTVESFGALIHPDDREAFWRDSDARLLTGAPFVREYRILRPDGETRWMLNRSHATLDAQGRVERTVGVCVDVTDRRQTEETLREADRRKDEFLAVLSHELRNPLAPLRNCVRVLEREPLGEQGRRTLDMAARQVGQLTRLVDDLLDVSRVSRGAIELRTERLMLQRTLREVVEATLPAAEERGLRLIADLPPEPVWVDADPARLAQVVENLLSNAVKFTDRGGEVVLAVRRGPGEVTIEVRDTGIGIAPEELSRVFEMFAQVDRSLDRSRSGLGIGLALVQRLVRMHGGQVTASSDGLGSGACLRVVLPAAAS